MWSHTMVVDLAGEKATYRVCKHTEQCKKNEKSKTCRIDSNPEPRAIQWVSRDNAVQCVFGRDLRRDCMCIGTPWRHTAWWRTE